MNDNPEIPGLSLLEDSPHGTYAVDLSQTIRFWNRSAERITGHKAEDVIGYPCYEVVQNCSTDEKAPWCRDGCPALQSIRENRIPSAYEVSMLCASGLRKTVGLTPMVVPEPLTPETLLVHLLHEPGNEYLLKDATEIVAQTLATPKPLSETSEQLTPREVEILKLTALGMAPKEISEALHISYHTVRNHTSNLRRKLGATNNSRLVRNAQESGLL